MCDLRGLKEAASLMRGELEELREVMPPSTLVGNLRQGQGQRIPLDAETRLGEEIRGV